MSCRAKRDVVALLVFTSLLVAAIQLSAQGTAFTYQGRLQSGSNTASGIYDLTFSVWSGPSGDFQVGSTFTNSATGVTNGLFTVTMDFGSVFDGNPRWIEIGVRTNGNGDFTTLLPRQQLTPSPYAVYAGGVSAAGISGNIPAGNIANGTITSNMLAAGTASANLAASGQSAVPGGAMLLSTNPNATNLTSAGYSRFGRSLDLSWQQRRSDSPRSDHTAVWSGTNMIVWGGVENGVEAVNTGGCYDPAANSWSPVTTSNSPVRRFRHTAVWTGSNMIVWGGVFYQPGGGQAYFQDTGGRYDPVSNNWVAVATNNAPSPRQSHTGVWTGSELIVWGGQITFQTSSADFNDGARYNPASDTWTPISTNGTPTKRSLHSAVWTGSEMIVWGGWSVETDSSFNDGARYNPTTDTWMPITTNNAPASRYRHSVVWTGSEMIIMGGSGQNAMNTGARYNPIADTWSPLPPNGLSTPVYSRIAVWTGSEMIVWGGDWYTGSEQTGSSYNPASNSWSALSSTGGPSLRYGFSGVWTGSEMIVFGGTEWINPHTGVGLAASGDTFSYTPNRVMYLYLRP